jgi:hypothetical protein
MSVYASPDLLPGGAIVIGPGSVLAYGLDGPEIVSFGAPVENRPVVPQDGREPADGLAHGLGGDCGLVEGRGELEGVGEGV